MLGRQSRRIPFWGWVIVGATMTIQFMAAGNTYYANAVFLVPLQDQFGATRTVISQGFALTNLVAAALVPVAGWVVDRWGPRRSILIGVSGIAVTAFMLSGMAALWQFYLLVALQQGALLPFAGLLPNQSLIGRWFARGRGRAMGLMMAGIGLGGLILPPLSGLIIEHSGWRLAYLVQGLLVAAIAVPAAALLLRDRPEDLRQHPDGAAGPPGDDDAHSNGASFGQAVRARSLWALAAVAFLCYAAHGVMSLQLPAMLQDVGLSVSRASGFLGLMLGLSVVGRLGIGGLADRFGNRRVLAVAAAGLGFSSLLVLARASSLGRISYVVIYGIFVGGTFTTMPLTAQSIFGMRAFGRIYVIVMLAVPLGTALGSYLGARVYDWQGSYTGSVLLACGAAVFASLLVLTLRRRDWSADRVAAIQTPLGR